MHKSHDKSLQIYVFIFTSSKDTLKVTVSLPQKNFPLFHSDLLFNYLLVIVSDSWSELEGVKDDFLLVNNFWEDVRPLEIFSQNLEPNPIKCQNSEEVTELDLSNQSKASDIQNLVVEHLFESY